VGVLQFNGSNDRLKWTTLQSALANVPTGAYTWAALLKRGGTGGWDAINYLLSSTGNGVAEAGFSFKGTSPIDRLIADFTGGGQNNATSNFTNTTAPYLFVVTKAAGSQTPVLYWKNGSAGAWTQENFSGAIADQTAATMIEIGLLEGASDPFVGHIGLIAWWSGAMSAGNAQALDDNWRTSDWWGSAHGQPVFLAELNVAAGSVVDLASNASSLVAESGGNYPALDAGETLDSWNFNGTGAGGSNTDRTTVVGAAALTGETPSPVRGTVLTPVTPYVALPRRRYFFMPRLIPALGF
jgi:hypothetical protein